MKKVILQPTLVLHQDDFRSTADGYHLDVWDDLVMQNMPASKDGKDIVEVEIKIISAFTG